MTSMRILLLVAVTGLTMTMMGPAHAAPGGTCGEGGGSWDTLDAVCAENEEVCIVWFDGPISCGFRPLVCC